MQGNAKRRDKGADKGANRGAKTGKTRNTRKALGVRSDGLDPRVVEAGDDFAEGSGGITTAILALTRDPVARDLLMELALDRGYGLCTAVFGTHAIRVLASEPPGLVVVDIDIPDGRALVRSMQADERWRGIPLIALASQANPRREMVLDAPLFLKPALAGLEETVIARFEPERGTAAPRAQAGVHWYENARFTSAASP